MADLSDFFEDGFDDNAVKASNGMDNPIPPGNYVLQVEKGEIAETKKRTGVILKMTMAVVRGNYEGSRIFAQFNVRNKSAQAQTIGIGEFKALCLACGVPYEMAKTDTDLLNHIPFNAVVGMEKESINTLTGQPYAPRNRVMKCVPAGADVPAAVTLTPGPAARAAAPSAGTPWKPGAGGNSPPPF